MRAVLLLMILYLAPVESDPGLPFGFCDRDCKKLVNVVECRIGIRGITVAEFDAETETGMQIRDAVIATIAENLKICGPDGDAQCAVNLKVCGPEKHLKWVRKTRNPGVHCSPDGDVKFGILPPRYPTNYPDREEKNMTFWKKVERNQLGDPAIVSFYVYTTEDQITKPRADANGYAISPAAKVLKELLDMSANQPKGITAKLKLNLAKIEGYVLPQMKIPDVFGGYTYLDDFSIGVWFQPAGLFALESIPPTHSAGLQAATVSFATLAVAGSAAALLMF